MKKNLEDSKLPGHSAPLWEPQKVLLRTSRTLPRTIAFVVAALWIVFFAVGTGAIASRDSEHDSGVNTLFTEGTTYYVAENLNSTGCTAYVRSTFTPSRYIVDRDRRTDDTLEKNTKIETSGQVFVRVFDTIIAADFEFDANFNAYLALDSVDSKMSLGQVVARFSLPSTEKHGTAVISVPGYEHRVAVNRPENINLIRRQDKSFSLLAPAALKSVIQQSQNTFTNLPAMKEVGEASYETCRQQFSSGNSGGASAADLGKILRMFHIDEKSPVLSHLTTR